MSKKADATNEAPPKPDPALARLERLVGTWRLSGRTLGANKDDVSGTTTFGWLHDDEGQRFFMQQDMELDYAGTPIRSHELIGYDPKTKAFASFVYSNMAGDPWPYTWNVEGDMLTIAIKHGPMDATYTGTFAADGQSFSGGWRPNKGADEEINAPYDITATKTG